MIVRSVCMCQWIVNMRIWIIMDYVTDDVIRAKSMSKLRTAIALSITELEHRSKLKMWQMLKAIFLAYSNSSVTSSKKFRRGFKMAASLKMPKY